MSRHDCKAMLAASGRDYFCHKHQIPFVAKSEVVPEVEGTEGTVRVCPTCVAEHRAKVAAVRPPHLS